MNDNKPLDLTLGTTNWKATLIEALQALPDGHIVNMYGGANGSASLVAAAPNGKVITLVAFAEDQTKKSELEKLFGKA